MPLTITNGTVEYERLVRPADFESKRFKVSFSFAIDGDTDAAAAADQVANDAISLAHRKLGLATDTVPAQATVQEAVAVPPTKRGGRKQAAPAPASVASGDAGATSAATIEDETAPVDQTATVAEISDKTLTDAVTKTRGRGISPQQVRDTILSFAPRMSEITQDKRADFLKALDALTAN